ncbi:HpcH/HpaI aldolase family protein [Colwellia sp. E150_009]
MYTLNEHAVWFSTPNIGLLEAVYHNNITDIVIDIEHGIFDITSADRFILTAKSMGLTVHAKVLSTEMSAIQQMLDIGVNSVIIPHIGGLEHAKKSCSYAKFAPLGDRSCAGGRTLQFGNADSQYFQNQNSDTRCYPMIETAEAFQDVDKILALDTVDGIFIGPTDLSLSQGRGAYTFDEIDKKMIKQIALAAKNANKPWIMPAWSTQEQEFAHNIGAYLLVFTHEQAILTAGLNAFLNKRG